MKVTLYYFTGTGNTLFIATQFKNHFEEVLLIPINRLDLSKPTKLAGDMVGILYPTYFLDAPEIIYQFINSLEIEGNPYVFIHANCGGTLGNALYLPKKKLEAKGIAVSGFFDVVVPDNSIIFPTPLNEQKSILEKAEDTIKKQIDLIKSRTISQPIKLSKGYGVISPGMKWLSKTYYGFNRIEIKGDACNGCGICSKVCSMENVKMEMGKPTFGHNCSMCFACIHYCPKQATRFKRMKVKGLYQYTNPHITLKEIIASRQ